MSSRFPSERIVERCGRSGCCRSSWPPPLQYVGDDARTFAQSMLELGGMDPRDLILLHDVDAGVLSRSLDLFAGNVREARRGGGRVEAVTPEARAPWTDGNWMQRSSFDGRLHQWPGAHVSLRA